MRVTVYIIGFNEEANLRELLPTVKWADEILYVDSFSTDGTAKFCAENGVRHENVRFEGFGDLRNKAIAMASNDWVVSIDTDERATPEFADEVRRTLEAPRHDAYFVPRRNTFMGHPVRFGGMYPDYRQPQVFDRRKLRYRPELVHEGFECSGSIGYLKNAIWQHPWPALAVAARKTERYTTLMAQRRFEAGRRAHVWDFLVAPPAGFLKKYLFQQGFRDGMPGFILAALHANYTFLKYAKLWELQHGRAATKA
ncbi:MAG: glycosyltransferase family 2 protein [Verrucomicrobia bacterium]|nr:glycosyltransferase family 2 protein [Verrucomicrobiota bacterium]